MVILIIGIILYAIIAFGTIYIIVEKKSIEQKVKQKDKSKNGGINGRKTIKNI